MSKATETEFSTIAEETIEAAEAVTCSFEEFVEGLAGIVEQLRDRLSMAKEELREKEGGEADDTDDLDHEPEDDALGEEGNADE